MIKVNTDETLNQKFVDTEGYPIWYYKELEEVDIDYIIQNLLLEDFVVEINGIKHEITFGKNKENQIGHCIKYNDIKSSNLCSYKVINKGFKEGKWYIVTDKDINDEFKQDYIKRKEEYEATESIKIHRDILSDVVRNISGISEEQRNKFLKDIQNYDYKQLKKLTKCLCKN